MTALAQRIKETPLAPYMGLLRGMTREQKQIVVTFLTESMEEPTKKARTNAEIIREKFRDLKISPETKWMIPRLPVPPEWDRQEAWNRLTDKQREEATRLNLAAEDMDERTVAIIEKHLR
ncbi:MAG: hypothetical protein IJS63_08770 [Bacteroidaceae bacterium]|nr:hypothetical protein [Bacteroidaceae bacterium]